jgi:photosynthetic reaction center cytochrome c subunit
VSTACIATIRDLSRPLTSKFPPHRLGILGDVAKVNCATCHQGVFKPLYVESMAKDYPELVGPMHPAETPAGDAPPTASVLKP